jgi:DnaK suppressor protein
MTDTFHLSQDQRVALADLLHSRLSDFEQDKPSQVEVFVSATDCSRFIALHEALDRIHRVSYGLCMDCQDTISFDRLMVEPQAMRCVRCQSAYEQSLLP